MKNALLVIIIAVFSFVNINAQETKLGVKGGLNLSSISGDNTEEIDAVTAFHFGIMAEIPFSNKFSFQPELIYSGQGYRINDNTVVSNYLNIPLMGKYYLTKGFSLEAGPQIGFLLSAKNEGIDIKDSYNKVYFGVNFGLGYKLDNGLNFGARYNLGLSDINNIDGFTSKNKNDIFQLSVGYFFF
ncbi:MAG: PorT family protein [Flavobacteriaceae bacterium]|nr:PorT family protein [Flavobacteriaceae bacterium]